MRRVRALRPFVTSGESHVISVGEIATVDDDAAHRLVAFGAAEVVEEPETGVRTAPETAEQPRPRRTRR